MSDVTQIIARIESGIMAPPAPLGIVAGCRYDFSLIAAIVSQKFAFPNPIYRQQDGFAQSGWFPSRSTINHWINSATDTVAPLFALKRARRARQRISKRQQAQATAGQILLRHTGSPPPTAPGRP